MRVVLVVLLMAGLGGASGCGEEAAVEGGAADQEAQADGAAADDAAADDAAGADTAGAGVGEETSTEGPQPDDGRFVVHEWGTYTSVQSSAGEVLEGLHHTDEFLPSFVRGRDLAMPIAKSMEALPEPVTQKLETPVLYFYTDEPLDVTVEVDFPQGVISEWYPEAASFGPAIHALERVGGGTMRWEARVDHGPARLIEVAADDIWAPSREVPEAATVRIGDDDERFIFYRGLGRFEMPLRVTHEEDGDLHVRNDSDDAVPAAFLLRVHEGGGAVVALGAVPGRGAVRANPGPKEIDLDLYTAQAAAQIQGALVDSGLTPAEAWAMVHTWERSYFRTPGLRVLYVAPRAWTDALLPLRLTPEPDELVRTLVGRVEVLTRDEEAALVRALEEDATSAPLDLSQRFVEPRLWRVMALTDDPQVQARCQSLIDALNMPEVP